MTSPLKIAVVDADAVRAAIVERGLHDAGLQSVTIIPDTANLLARLLALDPDVIVMDLASPSRDVLEQMFQVSKIVSRPVAMFVDRSDAAMTEAAIDAGVSAYVVDGLRGERIKPIIDMAIIRFRAYDKLRKELEEARNELADRRMIDRAKAILMKARNMTEQEAYALLRRKAMDDQKKIVDIAQAIITAAELMG